MSLNAKMLRRHIPVTIGLLLILLAVLGSIPLLNPRGYLLGILYGSTWLNIVHLLTGAIILAGSRTDSAAARRSYQLLGASYTIMGMVGVGLSEQLFVRPLLGTMPVALLHIAVGVFVFVAGLQIKSIKKRFSRLTRPAEPIELTPPAARPE